jgi:hypothetical protein
MLTNIFIHGGKLCTMPAELLKLMNNKLTELELKKLPDWRHGGGYKQWNIQQPAVRLPINKEIETDENIIVIPGLEPVIDFFNNYISNIFRFRLSILDQGTHIPFHPGHLYPRIHIPLSETKSTFNMRYRDGIRSVQLEYGNAYLVNVSISHEVVINTTETGPRRNAFFSFQQFKTNELNRKFNVNFNNK